MLIAFAVGVYGCGVAAGLVEFAYTRLYANQSGLSLVTVENTTSYAVAPWLEELVKISPLLLAGLSLKVRRQWGLTDYVVVGAALGGGFGLLEACSGSAWSRIESSCGTARGLSRTRSSHLTCRALTRR
ncbi:PrsW family glutamic-type intramembrane protease [Streptomyces sp. NPDC059906]|uniref:PrsW family glutamic-type intramembrane protease n=1 Tax=Streptomyces sp. NPDC059906 TaxID=3346997 RepID=UPI00364D3EF1